MDFAGYYLATLLNGKENAIFACSTVCLYSVLT